MRMIRNGTPLWGRQFGQWIFGQQIFCAEPLTTMLAGMIVGAPLFGAGIGLTRLNGPWKQSESP